MSSAADIQRWLILDQETDRADWGTVNHDGLVLTESGLFEGRPLASRSAAMKEICVVFLQETASTLSVPESYSNEGERRCRVWCHYGRDISTSELKQRWGTYPRLTEDDKRRLLYHPQDYPMPFSKSQPLAWSPEFSELKKLVANAANGKKIPKEDFEKCLSLLRSAWGLAGADLGVSARILQNKTALPAQLSARFVLESMPDASAWGLDTLGQVLEHCRRSGLSAAACHSDGFSTDLKDAYRKLHFHLLAAKGCVVKGSERLLQCENDEKPVIASALDWNTTQHFHAIRDSLEQLIRRGREGAMNLSESLTENPSKIGR